MGETCSMCEDADATTAWGFPVCQDCYDGLVWLHEELAKEEFPEPDPQLIDLLSRQTRIVRDDEADSGRGSDDA